MWNPLKSRAITPYIRIELVVTFRPNPPQYRRIFFTKKKRRKFSIFSVVTLNQLHVSMYVVFSRSLTIKFPWAQQRRQCQRDNCVGAQRWRTKWAVVQWNGSLNNDLGTIGNRLHSTFYYNSGEFGALLFCSLYIGRRFSKYLRRFLCFIPMTVYTLLIWSHEAGSTIDGSFYCQIDNYHDIDFTH